MAAYNVQHIQRELGPRPVIDEKHMQFSKGAGSYWRNLAVGKVPQCSRQASKSGFLSELTWGPIQEVLYSHEGLHFPSSGIHLKPLKQLSPDVEVRSENIAFVDVFCLCTKQPTYCALPGFFPGRVKTFIPSSTCLHLSTRTPR